MENTRHLGKNQSPSGGGGAGNVGLRMYVFHKRGFFTRVSHPGENRDWFFWGVGLGAGMPLDFIIYDF